MLSSLILQLMIDVLLIAVMAWLWLQQKKQTVSKTPHQVLEGNENRLVEYEALLTELRTALETERRKIQSLHDRIQKLIDQGALTSTIFPMSEEEEELKSLSTSPTKTETIPTLKQIEITRERLSHDTVVDLRTILRDQLA